MWIWLANCITYAGHAVEHVCRESSNRGHNTREQEHPGAAVPIKFRLRASGRRIAASGASTVTGRTGEPGDSFHRSPSSRLARASVYSNPKIFRSGDIFWTYATDNRSRSYMRPGNLYRQLFEFSKRPTGRGILNNLPRDSSYKVREIRTDFTYRAGANRKR